MLTQYPFLLLLLYWKLKCCPGSDVLFNTIPFNIFCFEYRSIVEMWLYRFLSFKTSWKINMPGCIFFCQHLGTFLLRNGNPWLSVYLSIILLLSTTLSCVTDKELQKCLVGWRGNLVLPLHLSWTSIGTYRYTEACPLVPRAWVINRSLFHWEGGEKQFRIKVKKKKKFQDSKAISNALLFNSRSCSA